MSRRLSDPDAAGDLRFSRSASGRRGDPCRSSGELIVWPRTVRLSSMPPLSGRELAVASLVSRQIGQEGDVLGVRPFRQGDSLRLVHWAQTARHDQLIVCERQATGRQAVRIVIDTDVDIHFGTGTAHSLEWCIRIAASLCQGFVEHLVPVELVIGNRRQMIVPGESGLRRGLDLLARFRPQADASADLSEAVALRAGGPGERRGDRRSSTGSRTVVVTTDRGWQGVPEPRQRTRELHVVLTRDDWEGEQAILCPDRSGGPWMTLRSGDTVLAQLHQQWEKVSNEGWFAVS